MSAGGNLPGGRAGWDLFEFNRAIEASGLPPTVQLVLVRLMFVPTRGGDGLADGRDLSVNALARRCGTKSRDTIERALRTAAAAGWLEFIRRGKGKRTAYRLLMPVPVDKCPDLPGERVSASPDLPGERVSTYPVSGYDLPGERVGIYPFLTEIPSIDQSVRARVRQLAPDLQPDDDEISTLIEHIERTYRPVRGVLAYLGSRQMDRAAVLRMLTEAQTVQVTPATTEPAAPAPDCIHGTPGGAGLTSAGTPRCVECRRTAQLSRSVPFSPSPDGLDRTGPANALDGLSAPLSAAVAG